MLHRRGENGAKDAGILVLERVIFSSLYFSPPLSLLSMAEVIYRKGSFDMMAREGEVICKGYEGDKI